MRNNMNKLLFSLLRSAITNKPITEDEKSQYSNEILVKCLQVADKHDIAHIVNQGIQQNGMAELIQEKVMSDKFAKVALMAIYRYKRLDYELDVICNALEKAQIPFLPLKGSILRDYYPEPWMRTSCDIDVLIPEKYIEDVITLFTEKYQFRLDIKGSHDVPMFSSRGIHVEFHYHLVEKGLANEAESILKDVWNVVVPKKGHRYHYQMPDDLFYFYHIAHMAKHFENGGCGIRPFIDLWILDRLKGVDYEKRDELLAKGNLLQFAQVARKLSKVWFENAEMDALSQQMEDYILTGGVYGSSENRITVQQQKKGGSFKYVLSRIFIPYDTIKFYYPILQKHRWLTPIMEVRRWGKLIFRGHLKRAAKELRYNKDIQKEEAQTTKQFLQEIGLLSNES